MSISLMDIIFILTLILLYVVPKKSKKWKWIRIISLCVFMLNIGIRIYLINRGYESAEEIRRLKSQISDIGCLSDLDTTGILPYQVVVISGDSKCVLADANIDKPAIGIYMGKKGQIQIKGEITNPNWNTITKPSWKAGQPLFLSTTPGEMSDKTPGGVAGTITQEVGRIISIDETGTRIHFEPKTPIFAL